LIEIKQEAAAARRWDADQLVQPGILRLEVVDDSVAHRGREGLRGVRARTLAELKGRLGTLAP
jgi:hypothetical protein